MVTKRGSPKEKFDQMCLYLRLFFGMGIIWYFELIAFFVNGAVAEEVFYLTDTLNMLQVCFQRPFFYFPGCLGVCDFCVQEKCDEGCDQAER